MSASTVKKSRFSASTDFRVPLNQPQDRLQLSDDFNIEGILPFKEDVTPYLQRLAHEMGLVLDDIDECFDDRLKALNRKKSIPEDVKDQMRRVIEFERTQTIEKVMEFSSRFAKEGQRWNTARDHLTQMALK